MPSTQEFRRRIKSVSSTKQITKAMEMIASIKMQKATKAIGQTRQYIQTAWNILHMVAEKTLENNHPLLRGNSRSSINPDTNSSTTLGARTAVILVTSDRGLCGSYNSEILKKLTSFIGNLKLEIGNSSSDADIISIGKVGAAFVNRYKIGKLIAEFKGFENNFSLEDIIPISKLTVGEYLNENYDKVVVIYSHFVSSLKQLPVCKQILPITQEHIDHPEIWQEKSDNSNEVDQTDTQFQFEPSPQAVVEGVLKQILRTQIYGAVLEANASEHSARMVAMKNATDNATDLVDELKLIYNSIRQDSITREIAEISGAAEAMK